MKRAPATFFIAGLAAAALLPSNLGAQPPAFDPQTGAVTSRRLRSGVPLGGIGCGTFQLMTDGAVSQVTVNNNWDRPTGDVPGAFAAVYTSGGGRKRAVALKLKSEYGLPTVAGITYRGLYPQAQLTYADPSLPVALSLRAFTPLIPGDRRNSSLPVAVFVFTVRNQARAPVEAAIALSWENLLGVGGASARGAFADRTGTTVEPIPPVRECFGLRMGSPGRPAPEPTDLPRYNSWGEYVLMAYANTPETRVTHAGWNALEARPAWWDGFAETGEVEGASPPGLEGKVHPAGVVAMRLPLKERETRELAFVVSWFTRRFYVEGGAESGHVYELSFRDAADVATYVMQNRSSLLALTAEWQNRLTRSSLPGWFSRKLINDASVLTANTLYTRDDGTPPDKGRPGPSWFAALEDPGVSGGALGSLDQRTYAHALLAAWFPLLDNLELEAFANAQAASGALPRSVGTVERGPVVEPGAAPAHADLAAAYVFQVWQRYLWSGDRPLLDRHYPVARRVLEWAAGLDADADGIPDGPTLLGAGTHALTWLAATRVGLAMAEVAGDEGFAVRCRAWHVQARAASLERVFNGRWLAHGPDRSLSAAAQLTGQWMADALGLGDLLPADVLNRCVETLLSAHDGAAQAVPPSEVDPATGKVTGPLCRPGPAAAYQAALYVLRGRPDAGVSLLQRIDRALNEGAGTPWRMPEAVGPELASPPAGMGHLSAPASWYVLNAITGLLLDVPAGRLTLTPRLPGAWKTLDVPVFASTFWGRLEYTPGARARLSLRFDRITGQQGYVDPGPTVSEAIRSAPGLEVRQLVLPAVGVGAPRVTVALGRAPVQGSAARDAQGRIVLTLDAPVTLIAGQRLTIDILGGPEAP